MTRFPVLSHEEPQRTGSVGWVPGAGQSGAGPVSVPQGPGLPAGGCRAAGAGTSLPRVGVMPSYRAARSKHSAWLSGVGGGGPRGTLLGSWPLLGVVIIVTGTGFGLLFRKHKDEDFLN